ncbi:MAG: hypothetical protein Q8R04_01465 [Nanoarchaeota archaeon]|nr:hypothetical protein [Nanoarchaeota archaeon]
MQNSTKVADPVERLTDLVGSRVDVVIYYPESGLPGKVTMVLEHVIRREGINGICLVGHNESSYMAIGTEGIDHHVRQVRDSKGRIAYQRKWHPSLDGVIYWDVRQKDIGEYADELGVAGDGPFVDNPFLKL